MMAEWRLPFSRIVSLLFSVGDLVNFPFSLAGVRIAILPSFFPLGDGTSDLSTCSGFLDYPLLGLQRRRVFFPFFFPTDSASSADFFPSVIYSSNGGECKWRVGILFSPSVL